MFPSRYQGRSPNDIAMRDIVRFTRINAAEETVENPNHRYQFNASMQLVRTSCSRGTHDFKAGVQLSRERMAYDRIRNGDILLETARRRAVPGADREHADRLGSPHRDVGGVPAGSVVRAAGSRSTRACGSMASTGYLPDAVEPGGHLRR